MDREAANKVTDSGTSFFAKERFDIAAKVVAIIGGLISAAVLIVSLRQSTAQRKVQLRWDQAKLAAQLEDDLLINDPQAFNALRMTDWGAYEFTIEGAKIRITREEVQQALDVKNNDTLSPKGVFVRENFDRLFYRMGKIERAIESDLIVFNDVCSPMDYYVPFLRSTHKDVLGPYMKQLSHTDALHFMERFDNSPKCHAADASGR